MPPDNHPPTIMFQAPNRIGLGHISRLMAIALEIRGRLVRSRVPFVIEGASHSLLEMASLPYISLPHRDLMMNTNAWQDWDKDKRMELVYGLSTIAIRYFQPDIIVCDSFPYGPFMTAASQLKVPLVLCARKTKDDRAYFEKVMKFESRLKMILIPHEEGEVAVPKELAARTKFVGNIVRSSQGKTERQLPGSKRILITGGGGGYAGTVKFFNLAIEAFSRFHRDHPEVHCTLVTGPLFEEWWDLRMHEHVKVIPFIPNLKDVFETVDLVVCQAGYNTISEMKQLGTPCICIPAPRKFDDQSERATQTANTAPNFRVYAQEDPAALAEMMGSLMAAPRGNVKNLPSGLNGARLAADLLLECIAQSARG